MAEQVNSKVGRDGPARRGELIPQCGVPGSSTSLRAVSLSNRGHALPCILLAAGFSRRAGAENKLLHEIEGEAIVMRTAKALLAGGVSRLVVVLGHEADEVRTELKDIDAEFVVNPDFGDGMGTSIATGARRFLEKNIGGLLVCVGDLPWLEAEDVRRVAQLFVDKGCESIVLPKCEQARGHPVAFPASCFEGLSKLVGDAGAKQLILKSGVPVAFVEVGQGCVRDVDTL